MHKKKYYPAKMKNSTSGPSGHRTYIELMPVTCGMFEFFDDGIGRKLNLINFQYSSKTL